MEQRIIVVLEILLVLLVWLITRRQTIHHELWLSEQRELNDDYLRRLRWCLDGHLCSRCLKNKLNNKNDRMCESCGI